MNQQPLALSNAIQWHEEGYTGKGVTIVIIDTDGKPRNHMSDYYVDLFGDQTDSGHGANVGYVAHLFSPGARIIFLDKRHRDRNYEWLAQNKGGIDLINISQAGQAGLPTPEYERYKGLGIPVICASGNDGYDDHISYPARYEWSIAIGAYHWRDKGAYANNVGGYSNGGKMLDAVAPAEFYMLDDDDRVWLVDGTSYAAPAMTGMLALYAQWRKESGLPKLTSEDARKFIHDNCKDLYEEGHDYRSGHGLFILPDITKMEVSNFPKPKEEDKVSEPIEFKDIDGHWAKAAIENVAAEGLMVGRSKDTFAPNEPITRAEMAAILSRLTR